MDSSRGRPVGLDRQRLAPEFMLCAITDRRIFGADSSDWRRRLLEQTLLWAKHGVDLIQLREKDLPARELVELTRAMRAAIDGSSPGAAPKSRLLVNGRFDIALAAGADGVHLPGGPEELTPAEIRAIFAAATARRPAAARRNSIRGAPPYISVACHTLLDVANARRDSADCILFAPVFEKPLRSRCESPATLPGTGVELLRAACQAAAPIPCLALGGVTAENAAECRLAGASGIAAIRLMHAPAGQWRPLLQGWPSPRH